MAVNYSPDSAYAKELVKWEGQYSQYGPPGRPYKYEDFPLSVYRASRPVGGGPITFEMERVEDESEERNLRSRGFIRGRDKAIELLEAAEANVAQAAAERAFTDRRMSEKAHREADLADAQSIQHLGEIPEQKRRAPQTQDSRGVRVAYDPNAPQNEYPKAIQVDGVTLEARDKAHEKALKAHKADPQVVEAEQARLDAAAAEAERVADEAKEAAKNAKAAAKGKSSLADVDADPEAVDAEARRTQGRASADAEAQAEARARRDSERR